MSGGLAARAAARELGREITAAEEQALLKRHGELFRQFLPERRPLPGAIDLLRNLRAQKILYGIATSGSRPEIDLSLDALGIGPETVVIERRDVKRAKPEPDLFLACQKKLGVSSRRVLRRRRRGLGPAGGAAGQHAERGLAERRLWRGRVARRRRVPRVSRCRGPAPLTGRAWHPALTGFSRRRSRNPRCRLSGRRSGSRPRFHRASKWAPSRAPHRARWQYVFPVGIHHVNPVIAAAIRGKGDLRAVGRPRRPAVVGRVVRQVLRVGSVRVHHEHLGIHLVDDLPERNSFPVRRRPRIRIDSGGRQLRHLTARDLDAKDVGGVLSRRIEIVRRAVQQRLAVRRPVRMDGVHVLRRQRLHTAAVDRHHGNRLPAVRIGNERDRLPSGDHAGSS